MLPARYSARLVSAAFLTVALLVCLVARLLTLSQPVLDIDEAAFAAAAVRAIDRQQPVLQASRDNKPPGIVALYRTAFAVGGIYNMPAVHGLGLLWALLTAGLLWIGCRDFATAAFADFAAGFYLLGTSLDPHFLAFKT